MTNDKVLQRSKDAVVKWKKTVNAAKTLKELKKLRIQFKSSLSETWKDNNLGQHTPARNIEKPGLMTALELAEDRIKKMENSLVRLGLYVGLAVSFLMIFQFIWNSDIVPADITTVELAKVLLILGTGLLFWKGYDLIKKGKL